MAFLGQIHLQLALHSRGSCCWFVLALIAAYVAFMPLELSHLICAAIGGLAYLLGYVTFDKHAKTSKKQASLAPACEIGEAKHDANVAATQELDQQVQHEHPMERTGMDAAWQCDGCARDNVTHAEMVRFRCSEGCDFDLCQQCCNQDSSMVDSIKPAVGNKSAATSAMRRGPRPRGGRRSHDAQQPDRAVARAAISSRATTEKAGASKGTALQFMILKMEAKARTLQDLRALQDAGKELTPSERTSLAELPELENKIEDLRAEREAERGGSWRRPMPKEIAKSREVDRTLAAADRDNWRRPVPTEVDSVPKPLVSTSSPMPDVDNARESQPKAEVMLDQAQPSAIAATPDQVAAAAAAAATHVAVAPDRLLELASSEETCWSWVRQGRCNRGLSCPWKHPPLFAK